jgi:diguanylate cyclase (GGDEF)-like protein
MISAFSLVEFLPSEATFLAALALGVPLALGWLLVQRGRGANRRLADLADAAVEGLVILVDNRVVEVNDVFLQTVGLSRNQLLGRRFLGTLLHAEFGSAQFPHSMLWDGQVTPEGKPAIPVEVIARPIEFLGRSATALAIRDVAARQDAEMRIRFLAEHDFLTGLANRASFHRTMERRCAALGGEGNDFALIYLDLDHFKDVNDRHGHLAGDAVLIEAATRLKDLLSPSGFIARLGGDEFIILLPDVQNTSSVAQTAERIVESLRQPFSYLGQRFNVGVSLGVALAPHNGDALDILLARADLALYRAKLAGRGGYCFFEESMDREMRVRRQLAFDMRDAIESNQIELHYQPIARTRSGEIVGFEVLIRWHHPRHGIIAPQIVISIAEESGFIGELGTWILTKACREAASWRRPLKISVNLSSVQLGQIALPEMVQDILNETGLPATRLEVEVTESGLLLNPDRSLDILNRLKALGVTVAIDDFGVGSSSLATLQTFPLDKIKIDRSFIEQVETNPKAGAILTAMAILSRSLDLNVVAEGVESRGQIDFLASKSCDEVQGFMIGKPLPISGYRQIVDYIDETSALLRA